MTLPPEAAALPQRFLQGATLLASRELMLDRLPKHTVFVEVGVGLGGFTRLVIDRCHPARFIAIDDFKLHELAELWGRSRRDQFGDLTHLQYYEREFAADAIAGTLQILVGDSAAQLASLADASVDIIYIDADHRYEWVRRDLDLAVKKIKPDGWIIVNDYIMVAELHAIESYGVVHAANEFMLQHNWGIQFLALHTRMFCDVALRPCDQIGALAASDLYLGELTAMRGSTSWRITAPLRALSRAARRLAGLRPPVRAP